MSWLVIVSGGTASSAFALMLAANLLKKTERR